MPFDWISLAQGGMSVLGNIIGGSMTNKRARAAQRRQHNYALKEMDYQFGLNKQAFDLENEYNSPLAQRQRMYEAGLNPNFSDINVASQMGSSAIPSGPSGGYSDAGDLGLSNAVQLYMQKKNFDEQKRVNQSAIDLNKANENLAKQTASKLAEEERGVRLDNDNKPQSFEDVHQLTMAEIAKYEEDVSFTKVQSENYVRELDHRIKVMDEQGGFYAASTKEKEAIITQLYETLPLIKSKYGAETAELYARAKAAEAGIAIAWYNAETGRFSAVTDRRVANEMIRHNVRMEDLQETLQSSQISVNEELASLYHDERAKVSAEAVRVRLENGLRRDLRSSKLDFKLQSLLVEKVSAEADKLRWEGELTRKEAETYLLRLVSSAYSSMVSTNASVLKDVVPML